MNAFWADAIVVVHFGLVAFCVAGEIGIFLGSLLKWRWVYNLTFRMLHLGFILYVTGESLFGVVCPLTEWEYDLRSAAGQSSERSLSFVARIIRTMLFYDFPLWVFSAMYIGFGLIVLLTFIFVKPRRGKKV